MNGNKNLLFRKEEVMLVGFIIALAIYYSLLAIWYLSQKDRPATEHKEKPKKTTKESGIIGESSYVKRKQTQVDANTTTNCKPVENEPIFVAETDTEPVVSALSEEEKSEDSPVIVIPLEKLDEVFSDEEFDEEPDDVPEPDVNWEEEEEELKKYQAEDDGNLNFASGVSFEELERLDVILKQPENPVDEVAEAGVILNKISGTELFEHVLSALPDALERISKQIEEQVAISHAEKRKIPEWMNFDIKNYT